MLARRRRSDIYDIFIYTIPPLGAAPPSPMRPIFMHGSGEHDAGEPADEHCDVVVSTRGGSGQHQLIELIHFRGAVPNSIMCPSPKWPPSRTQSSHSKSYMKVDMGPIKKKNMSVWWINGFPERYSTFPWPLPFITL